MDIQDVPEVNPSPNLRNAPEFQKMTKNVISQLVGDIFWLNFWPEGRYDLQLLNLMARWF